MTDGLRAWKVNSREFPHEGTEAEKLRFLVKYAVLAPSKYNAQPWLFEICRNSLDIICDRNWAFRVTDPRSRELTLSCGAALFNLRLAARHFGYEADVEPFPWPGDRYLQARVRLREGTSAQTDESPEESESNDNISDEDLFDALKKRRTYLGAFWNGAPPDQVLTGLSAAAEQFGAWLHVVKAAPARHELAALVAQADRRQMADRAFRRELIRWIHPRSGKSKDGMPGCSYGLSGPFNVLTHGLPLLFRVVNCGALVGLHHRELAERSPVLVVLGTASDTPEAWLAAGQALQSVLLHITADGLAASFLNAPIQVENLRRQLGQAIGRNDFPQVLLRLGYGMSAAHTPRRSAEEVLI
jgi:hypothetical protein